ESGRVLLRHARPRYAAAPWPTIAPPRTVAGDFFESVPAGDLYLLRFILHDWNDEDCIRILKNCRRAMLPNSRVVLVESYLGRMGEEVGHEIADTQGAIIDLHMFVVVGGR